MISQPKRMMLGELQTGRLGPGLRILAGATLLLLLQTASPGPIASEPLEPGLHHVAVTSDGGERSFSLYIPSSYDPAVQWPLVLLFHAFGGEGERMLRSYGWDDIAETKGFLVVAPDGEWFETQGRSWAARSLLDPPVDDVAFVEGLLGSLSNDYALDTNRIYVVGNSQGGSMAYRLACELPERLAAVAAVATAPGGGRSNPEQAGCNPAPHQWHGGPTRTRPRARARGRAVGSLAQVCGSRENGGWAGNPSNLPQLPTIS